MALLHETEAHHITLMNVARLMMSAARTSPKGKGVSNLESLIISGADMQRLAIHLDGMGKALGIPSFIRDARNLEETQVALALGTRINPIGLKRCGMCGFANCEEKKKFEAVPCVFNTGDLGIAVGSAVSVAMDNRVDNRVMYTAGQALIDLRWMGEDVKIIYLIPLSISSKNIYFDRS